MSIDRIAIVIPYYHNKLTELEQISWVQAVRIFEKYQIIAVVPDNMSEEDYPKEEGLTYEVVPASWMKSVETYNQMMVEVDFYNRFVEYEYILLYQLDAFVFQDELQCFCDYGYDYIGAPWMKGVKHFTDLKHGVWYVGNGGLSLRNIGAALNVLDKVETTDIKIPEDVFWASCSSESFKVAPLEIALQFSFDSDVRACYEKNNYKIPFGCHAWEDRDFAFWKPLIEKEGYNISLDIVGDWDYTRPMVDFRYLDLSRESIYNCGLNFFQWKNKQIYIWGSGLQGEECGWLLMRAGCEDFLYMDSSLNKVGKTLWEREIIATDSLEEIKSFEAVIIVAVAKEVGDIVQQLENKGYELQKNVFIFSEWREQLKMLIE